MTYSKQKLGAGNGAGSCGGYNTPLEIDGFSGVRSAEGGVVKWGRKQRDTGLWIETSARWLPLAVEHQFDLNLAVVMVEYLSLPNNKHFTSFEFVNTYQNWI